MSIDVRAKGKRFEREIAKRVGGRRTPCSGGLDIKGDVRDMWGAYKTWIIECKHQEKGGLWAFVRQAKAEIGASLNDWIVVWKRNNEQPIAIIDFEVWCNMVEELHELREKVQELVEENAGEAL